MLFVSLHTVLTTISWWKKTFTRFLHFQGDAALNFSLRSPEAGTSLCSYIDAIKAGDRNSFPLFFLFGAFENSERNQPSQHHSIVPLRSLKTHLLCSYSAPLPIAYSTTSRRNGTPATKMPIKGRRNCAPWKKLSPLIPSSAARKHIRLLCPNLNSSPSWRKIYRDFF